VTEADLTAQYKRRRKQAVIVVLTLLFALALAGGFRLGQHVAYSGMGAKPKSYRAMQKELVSVRNALQSKLAELEIQRTRHEVDRQALEMVRKEMAGQSELIAGLEEGLGFYRSLISPEAVAPGLSLRKIEILAAQEPGHYLYRIVVQQEARKYEQLKGTLDAVVTGVAGGQPVEYNFAALSEGSGESGAALDFRYFQSIEGRIVLPAGFVPSGVTVEAHTVSPHQFQIREEFPWQIEERFTHVGK
jgi:hypothetical protein